MSISVGNEQIKYGTNGYAPLVSADSSNSTNANEINFNTMFNGRK